MDPEAIRNSRARQAANSAGPSPASRGDRDGAATERRAIGYGRLSPGERKDAAAVDGRAKVGVGMVDQRQKIEKWCAYKGCELVAFVEDVDKSGKDLARDGIQQVLARMDAGDAEVLVAAKLERLARSVRAFGELLERSVAGGWAIVVLDFDLDTSKATGRLVVNVMMSVAQWEREAIGERTRDALAVKRAQGVRLGRPPVVSAEVVARIRGERELGRSLQQIADGLTADEVATAHGGVRWYKSTVRAMLS